MQYGVDSLSFYYRYYLTNGMRSYIMGFMSSISDAAVVLSRLDYSETSQVLVLFTHAHGKVRVMGKGLKKSTKTRFAAGIDILDIGHLTISARHVRTEQLSNLIEWKQTRNLSGLRETLPRLYAAQYIAEITARLTEDWDPHETLFLALTYALEAIADADLALLPVVAYQKQLLQEIGSYPRFDLCLSCQRADHLSHFSSFEGGMICQYCQSKQVEKKRILPATLAALLDQPTEQTCAGAFKTLNYHISHQMGKEPALARKLLT